MLLPELLSSTELVDLWGVDLLLENVQNAVFPTVGTGFFILRKQRPSKQLDE